MIDQHGFIVDKDGDAGDSCSFTCTGIILGLYANKDTVHFNAVEGFWNNGRPVRHPHAGPNYANPHNFTRDQAVPLMWVLEPVRIAQFLSNNGCFFPNVERDLPGSGKKCYPHKFYKDSRPDTTTVPWWKKLPAYEGCEIESKSFDYADLMTPDFIGMCRYLMGDEKNWIMPLARFWCRHSIEAHCTEARKDKTFADFKQLYFTAKALGLHQEFAEQHPWGLYFAAEEYFTKRRSLPDLEHAFVKEFKREGIKE